MIHGVNVGIVDHAAHGELAFQRIAAGLELIAQFEPHLLNHLCRNSRGILVWNTESASGMASWHYGAKLIIVDAGFLCARETTPAKVASVLVHESTHSRLDRFGYRSEARARVEAVCFRRERNFAQRLPESDELVAEIDRQLRRERSYWDEDARIRRGVHELSARGVPSWLIRAILRLSGRSSSQ